MNYRIDTLSEFDRELKWLSKKYRSIKQDYARLIDELHANPTAGADLGDGVHKVRMAIASKNRGKSHGARVITYVYRIDEESGIITLLTIYDKEKIDAISAEEIARLKALAKAHIDLLTDASLREDGITN